MKTKLMILVAALAVTFVVTGCDSAAYENSVDLTTGEVVSDGKVVSAGSQPVEPATEVAMVSTTAIQEAPAPGLAATDPALANFLRLVGKSSKELSVIGEPGRIFDPITQDGVTFRVYEWFLPAKNGKQSDWDWNYHYEAAVDTATDRVIAVELSYRRNYEAKNLPFPKMDEILAFFGADEDSAEFSCSNWESNSGPMKIGCRKPLDGGNVLILNGLYDGPPPIEKVSKTDFSTGEQATFLRRRNGFSTFATEVSHVYVGVGNFSTFKGKMFADTKPGTSGTRIPRFNERVPVKN